MEIPDELIELERAAEAAREALTGLDGDEHAAQWQRWYEAAVAVQHSISEHAAGTDRYELEMAVKKAVRHPQAPPAAAA
ncbi:hypothetical protein RCO28_34550 [Streptomyces sp. LHD-70]|uniref:hypothetical protein n=1 Tax=Streptomyces sp. LHD-70 TaxID=3072140 RepID=UPI00280E9174|nr:hypothetical protein [Streptomyces sp. LHD-70]MDQ8707554.1 hypothetical protein [Streptomyces sp. LHD-70]